MYGVNEIYRNICFKKIKSFKKNEFSNDKTNNNRCFQKNGYII